MIDWKQDPRYLHWAEARLNVKFDPRTVSYLTSLDQHGSILGVVVFSEFTGGRNCELTVVGNESRRFISKEFALSIAGYVWFQCRFERVTAVIAVNNAQSLNLAQQLGFQEEGRLRKWFPNSDAIILGLLREDCKWFKVLNEKSKAAAGS